jgi:hypothetical protein
VAAYGRVAVVAQGVTNVDGVDGLHQAVQLARGDPADGGRVVIRGRRTVGRACPEHEGDGAERKAPAVCSRRSHGPRAGGPAGGSAGVVLDVRDDALRVDPAPGADPHHAGALVQLEGDRATADADRPATGVVQVGAVQVLEPVVVDPPQFGGGHADAGAGRGGVRTMIDRIAPSRTRTLTSARS